MDSVTLVDSDSVSIAESSSSTHLLSPFSELEIWLIQKLRGIGGDNDVYTQALSFILHAREMEMKLLDK